MKRRLFLLLASLALCAPLASLHAADAPPKGLKIVTVAHSFHVWMPPILQQIAGSSGIQGHEQLDAQSRFFRTIATSATGRTRPTQGGSAARPRGEREGETRGSLSAPSN